MQYLTKKAQIGEKADKNFFVRQIFFSLFFLSC